MKLTQQLALLICGLITLPVLAATFKLDASGQEPLYRVELPKAVYQYSRSEHLSDLTIHNASGEQVPYALLSYETLHPLSSTTQDIKPLPVYPINEYQLINFEELNLKIRNADKHNMDPSVYLRINSQVKDAKSIYLIDVGKGHPALQSLSVDWLGSKDALLSLDILASDDLKTWSDAGHAVLLKTSAEDSALLQNGITLDYPTEKRFLQIRPSDANALILTKVNANYSNMQTVAPNLHWQDLRFMNREVNKKTSAINLDFESSGRHAISRLHVTLPEVNTITSVKVLAKKSDQDQWQYISTASLYYLTRQGKSYTNPDITLYPTSARYWRLQFDQNNGGLGQENPGLSVGWLPDTIVWNARGQAPFTLQVGSNPDIVNNVSINSLIPGYGAEPEQHAKKIQQLSQSDLHADVDAMNQSHAQNVNAWASPPDYKRWLLWGGLMLGVLLLAGMAYSLLKSKDSVSSN